MIEEPAAPTTEENYKETADDPRGETRWPVVPPSDVVLHPSSTQAAMKARLKVLGEPIYGAKDVLWARLSKAETREAARRAVSIELQRRHELAAAGEASIEPRTIKSPELPSAAEIERHRLTHTPPAPWCEECPSGGSDRQNHIAGWTSTSTTLRWPVSTWTSAS